MSPQVQVAGGSLLLSPFEGQKLPRLVLLPRTPTAGLAQSFRGDGLVPGVPHPLHKPIGVSCSGCAPGVLQPPHSSWDTKLGNKTKPG